jgi:hypothetical protein
VEIRLLHIEVDIEVETNVQFEVETNVQFEVEI